ncbi:MAG: hypothetical protein AAFO97_12535 [Pseudomonadota bacterium]
MTLKSGYVFSAAVTLALISGHGALAQGAAIDCADPANAEAVECLNLPEGAAPVTNFVPLVGVLGGAALLGLAGGSGGTTSTSSTTSTSTTSTTSP